MSRIDEFQQNEYDAAVADILLKDRLKSLPQFWGTGCNLDVKLWILPDGKIVQLDQRHWEWLRANRDIAVEFGIVDAVRTITDEIQGHRHALKAGFFCVNYTLNGGTLIVEGCRRHWCAVCHDAVFTIIAKYAGVIDAMKMTLFDDAVGNVVASAYARLVEYGDEEKLENIPLLSASARGRALFDVHKIGADFR